MINPDQERFGEDAINQYILRSSVFLVPGRHGDKPDDIGSGTIICTPKSNFVVLTAKHVAEDAQRKEYRLGYGVGINPLSDFVAGILLPPGEVDVALLIVKESLSPILAERSIKPESVAHHNNEILDDDCLILNGFASSLTRYNEKNNIYGLVSITYWRCKLSLEKYDEKGRYRVEWKDAEQFRGNESLDLPEPYGISGGPLWRFRKSPKSPVWSPAGIGNIVGIQSAWDGKEILLVEPVQKWGHWFKDSIETVDRNYSSPIN
jgi:hypothetical protein